MEFFARGGDGNQAKCIATKGAIGRYERGSSLLPLPTALSFVAQALVGDAGVPQGPSGRVSALQLPHAPREEVVRNHKTIITFKSLGPFFLSFLPFLSFLSTSLDLTSFFYGQYLSLT